MESHANSPRQPKRNKTFLSENYICLCLHENTISSTTLYHLVKQRKVKFKRLNFIDMSGSLCNKKHAHGRAGHITQGSKSVIIKL
jgi:hypothetical protein